METMNIDGSGRTKLLLNRVRVPRGIVIGLSLLAAGAAALGWPWLVAIGIAPILLSVAPCAAMCALGLCMMRKGEPPMPPTEPDTLSPKQDPVP